MRASFGYVVQGRAVEVRGLTGVLRGREHRLLSWDEEVPGALFLPGSTWSEGRRIGLEALRSSVAWERLEYVVFMDADAAPTPELLDRFELEIGRLRPAVAVPVLERLVGTAAFVDRSWQIPLETDEQVQAFRRELIEDFFQGSPYASAYDDRSWWYPCVVNQSAIRKHLWRSTVQLNAVRFPNDSHGAYPNRFEPPYIDAELRRLGLRGVLPLGAYERHTISRFPALTKRRRRRIDRGVARVLAVLSPVLYRRWGRFRPGRPSRPYLELLRSPAVR